MTFAVESLHQGDRADRQERRREQLHGDWRVTYNRELIQDKSAYIAKPGARAAIHRNALIMTGIGLHDSQGIGDVNNAGEREPAVSLSKRMGLRIRIPLFKEHNPVIRRSGG